MSSRGGISPNYVPTATRVLDYGIHITSFNAAFFCFDQHHLVSGYSLYSETVFPAEQRIPEEHSKASLRTTIGRLCVGDADLTSSYAIAESKRSALGGCLGFEQRPAFQKRLVFERSRRKCPLVGVMWLEKGGLLKRQLLKGVWIYNGGGKTTN
ncbi:hypothetical protein NPIL_35581 [Nephila pilipes]|uniref:Uncharacterized protein n=1 Tax=Nephila pilipes TaxID=299642 RepID=A0A8X6UC76_NEPPI|nr:hypothetical protein NPIL_35581 [Nephila pilipes]